MAILRHPSKIFGFSAKKLTIRIRSKEAKMTRPKFCHLNKI